MSTSTRNLLVAGVAIAGVLLLLRAVSASDPGQRRFEIFTEMAYSRAFESDTPNPFFADGKTRQPLVAGVVPRGHEVFRYGASPEEAARAGRELTSPFAADDAAAAAAGGRLFAISCTPCHDARGGGQGRAALRGVLPPPSLHGASATGLPDGAFYHLLTLGRGNMAAVAGQLSPRERWQVIAHVRALQREGP